MTVFKAESGSLICSYSVICQGMGTFGNVNLNNNAYPNDVQTMSLSIVCQDQSIIGDLSMSTIIEITLGAIVILSVTIISINCKCNTADDSGGVIYLL